MVVRRRRACALVLAAFLVLGAGACGDDDDSGERSPSTTEAPNSSSTSAAPTTTAASGIRIERTVTGGALQGEPGREAVPVGEEVTIVVNADVEEEVHVHGYDLFGDVAPGQPAEVTFVADIPGVFEVELEGAHLLLVELEVS